LTKPEEEEFRSPRKELDEHGAELDAGIRASKRRLRDQERRDDGARLLWRASSAWPPGSSRSPDVSENQEHGS
jgi:hypothetical protein